MIKIIYISYIYGDKNAQGTHVIEANSARILRRPYHAAVIAEGLAWPHNVPIHFTNYFLCRYGSVLLQKTDSLFSDEGGGGNK